MNKRQIPKVKAIIRTLLLTTGPKSAREISEFIDFNNFNLGKQSISAQQISSLIKGDNNGLLRDVKSTSDHVKKYYIPGRDVYV